MVPWLVLVLLVAINALYVAAEFAAVGVQRSDVAALARRGSSLATKLLAVIGDGVRLDRYIAACQIGITLSSLVAGAYAQATFAIALGPWLGRTSGAGHTSAESAAFVIVLLVLTTVQVVFGELVPKSLALQFPVRSALVTFLPTRWSASALRGFIWLLNGSGHWLLRPFGITPGGHQHVHSPDEIEALLSEARREGALSAEAHRRLERGLHLSSRTVRQLMTPRSEVYGLEVSMPPEEMLARVLESPYGWLPVYRGSLDDVLGVVSIKEVVAVFVAQGALPRLEQVLRPIPFVPESLRSHRFVRLLQEQRSARAMVVDEHGGIQGIISIEDVIADLFGELGDELKQPGAGPIRLPDGSLRVPGTMRLDEAEPWLRSRWAGRAVTAGGHVVDALGRLPQGGERLTIDGVEVTIAEMSATAIVWLTVIPPAPGLEAETTASPTGGKS